MSGDRNEITITVSGHTGSGKSTIATLLKELLCVEACKVDANAQITHIVTEDGPIVMSDARVKVVFESAQLVIKEVTLARQSNKTAP